MAGAGCADEITVDAAEPRIHQCLDAVQMLDAVLLLQRVALAVFIVIGFGNFPAVGDFFALGVPDRAGGQVGVDGSGFRLCQVDIDAAETFDDLGNPVEIDRHVFADVQFKVVVDGSDTGFRCICPGRVFSVGIVIRMAVAVGDECLVLSAGHFHEGVAGDGRKLDRSVAGVQRKDDQHVGTLCVFALFRELLFILGSPDVQTDEQDVDDVVRQVLIDLQFVGINGIVQFILGREFLNIFLADAGKIKSLTGIIILQDHVSVFVELIIFVKIDVFHEFFGTEILLVELSEGKDGEKKGKGQDQGKNAFHIQSSRCQDGTAVRPWGG